MKAPALLFLLDLQISSDFMWIMQSFYKHVFSKTLMNGCFWKPCLFEFNWTIYRMPIWGRQSKIQNNILKILNNICPIKWGIIYIVKILSFMVIKFFVFQSKALQFSKFLTMWPNLTKAILRLGYDILDEKFVKLL